jgi:hypothetical protein
MITENNELSNLLDAVFAQKGTPAIRSVIEIIEILIKRARISNDTASGEVVYQNQGGIRYLLTLKDYLEKGPISLKR